MGQGEHSDFPWCSAINSAILGLGGTKESDLLIFLVIFHAYMTQD